MAGNTYIAILFQSLKQNKKLACSKFKTNKQMVKKIAEMTWKDMGKKLKV